MAYLANRVNEISITKHEKSMAAFGKGFRTKAVLIDILSDACLTTASLYMTKKLSSTQRQIITNWVWKAWSQY